jgi:TolA-binding protein
MEVCRMKHLTMVLPVSTVIVLATLFFGCSSTNTEKTKEGDEFFKPLDEITYKRPGDGSEYTVRRDRTGTVGHQSVSEQILTMLREQNRQLNNVVQELNTLTKRESADSLKGLKNLTISEMIQERASNQMLVEMIREQNLRLNDVVGQLKLLSQFQQSNQNKSYAKTESTSPVRQASVSSLPSPKSYDIPLGYGKAIQLYQQRKYQLAIQAFQSLLNGGVQTEIKDNCHFWIGVCYFNLNKIDQAMNKFTSVLNIAGSDKREGAYFMIGQCYEQIGANENAKATFEKMMRKYPTGSLKQMAEIKLALLK